MPNDIETCMKHNIHSRSKEDIQKSIEQRVKALSYFVQLNYQSLIDEYNETQHKINIELDIVSDDEDNDSIETV